MLSPVAIAYLARTPSGAWNQFSGPAGAGDDGGPRRRKAGGGIGGLVDFEPPRLDRPRLLAVFTFDTPDWK